MKNHLNNEVPKAILLKPITYEQYEDLFSNEKLPEFDEIGTPLNAI